MYVAILFVLHSHRAVWSSSPPLIAHRMHQTPAGYTKK